MQTPISDDPSNGPSVEVCDDGLDNDHDGQVDEQCPCNPLATPSKPCYPGPSVTRGVNACKDGLQQCVVSGEFSTWGVCVDFITPEATETCGDEIDNNCDGEVDEGCNTGDGNPDDVDDPNLAPRCRVDPNARTEFGQKNPFAILGWARGLGKEVGLNDFVDPSIAGAVARKSPMPDILCQLAGFQRAISTDCESRFGDRGRNGCGFDSCDNNVMAVWDEAIENVRILNACRSNTWISDIRCGC